MKEERSILQAYWWEKLYPLRRKFIRETHLLGLDESDLEQECYLRLHEAMDEYDPDMGVPFPSYYKIKIYGWRSNQYRHKWRKDILIGEDEYLKDRKDTGIDIEREVEVKLLLEEVLGKLDALDERSRTLITSYYLHSKTLKEIALEMGIPYKTAETRKRTVLGKLRTMLGPDKP